MSKSGRVNHLVTALQQSGFYPKKLEKPGLIDDNVRIALNRFIECRVGNSESVSRVVNAFRNVSPTIFRGFGKSCNQVTPALITAVEFFITENDNDQVQIVPAMIEEELSGVYAD